MDIAEVKRKARTAASKRRAEAHEILKDTAGLAMAKRGLPAGLDLAAGIVSGFIPYKSEITTVPMLSRLHRDGWQTCLPIVIAQEEPLVFRAWAPGDPLVPGAWDIPVPVDSAPEVLPDVLLVPMLLRPLLVPMLPRPRVPSPASKRCSIIRRPLTASRKHVIGQRPRRRFVVCLSRCLGTRGDASPQ